MRHAELIEPANGASLQEPLQPPTDVYFPNDGAASVVAVMEDGAMIEAAVVGIDGFVGTPVALRAERSTTRVIWQVPGSAYRIPAARFESLVATGGVGPILFRYIQQLGDQMAQVAGCNRRHPIIERAARWLLMVDDRVDGSTFMLTQEFLATMLGVGRPKVTLAAQQLQQTGLISYRRGVVTISDRAGLEQAACDCYDVLAGIFPGSGAADTAGWKNEATA
jgi:CRP-like cAMP-binding protein